MAHLIKDKTMTKTTGNDGARYQLAREGAYNVQSFGPPMTLVQAQRYQSDMALANVPVLVVRLHAQ